MDGARRRCPVLLETLDLQDAKGPAEGAAVANDTTNKVYQPVAHWASGDSKSMTGPQEEDARACVRHDAECPLKLKSCKVMIYHARGREFRPL